MIYFKIIVFDIPSFLFLYIAFITIIYILQIWYVDSDLVWFELVFYFI